MEQVLGVNDFSKLFMVFLPALKVSLADAAVAPPVNTIGGIVTTVGDATTKTAVVAPNSVVAVAASYSCSAITYSFGKKSCMLCKVSVFSHPQLMPLISSLYF